MGFDSAKTRRRAVVHGMHGLAAFCRRSASTVNYGPAIITYYRGVMRFEVCFPPRESWAILSANADVSAVSKLALALSGNEGDSL